jgi:hypothetical protein
MAPDSCLESQGVDWFISLADDQVARSRLMSYGGSGEGRDNQSETVAGCSSVDWKSSDLQCSPDR